MPDDDNDDEQPPRAPLVDTLAAGAGYYPSSALAEPPVHTGGARVAEAQAAAERDRAALERAQTQRLDMARRMFAGAQKSTGILAPEVKRIEAANLTGTRRVRAGVNEAREKELECERRKDELYNLLSNNEEGSVERLNHYMKLAKAAAVAQGIYPIDAELESERKRDTDAKVVEEGFNYILRGDRKAEKRAYLLQCLHVCNEFVEVFCPRTGQGAFRCNPEKLNEFLRDVNSPFVEIYSRYIAHQYTTPIFVTAVLTEWTRRTPWVGMDFWRGVRADEPSAEVRMHAQLPANPTGAGARARYYLTGAAEGNQQQLAITGGEDEND
jgi:hypothetical protein